MTVNNKQIGTLSRFFCPAISVCQLCDIGYDFARPEPDPLNQHFLVRLQKVENLSGRRFIALSGIARSIHF